MNKINILALSLIAISLVACGGADERKKVYMDKAEKSIDSGDLDKARIELMNVLQIDPKYADAYFKVGYVFERKRSYIKAFSNYNKALDLDPENIKYQAKIGQFNLIMMQDIDKAKDVLEKIKKKDTNNMYGMMLEAGILLKENKIPEARSIVADVNKQKPGDIEASIFLSKTYVLEEKYNESVKVLENALTYNPGNQVLTSQLVDSLYAIKDYKKTEKVLLDLIMKHPDLYGNHVRLALFYKNMDRLPEAKSVLQNAIELKDDVERKLMLVEFTLKTQGAPEAINEVKNLIQSDQDNGELRLALAKLQIAQEDITDAKNTYLKIASDFPENEAGVKARTNLANLYMQDDDVTNAEKYINEALQISPNDAEVNYVKAKIDIFNKNYEQAIISLRTVIKDEPENLEAYFLLSAAHEANGESDQAYDVVTMAYENNRANKNALLPIAKYFINNKKLQLAEEAVNDYLKLDNNSYDALSMKAALLNEKRQKKEAFEIAQLLLDKYPEKIHGYIQAVPKMLEDGDADKAKELLATGYEKTSDPRVAVLLAKLHVVSKSYDDAIDLLKQVISSGKGGKQGEMEISLANAYVIKGDVKSAVELLDSFIEKAPGSTKVYIALANIHVKNKNDQTAIDVLSNGINNKPKDVDLKIALASVYEKTGDIDKAIRLYEDSMAVDDDNLLVINNLASLLAEYRSDDASITRATDLVKKLSDIAQPFIQDTVGWVYYKNGQYKDALSYLEKAVAAVPDHQVFNYHTGMAYYKSIDYINAKKYLGIALKNKTEFNGRSEAESVFNSI